MYHATCEKCKKGFPLLTLEFNPINNGTVYTKKCPFKSAAYFEVCPYCNNHQNFEEYHLCIDLYNKGEESYCSFCDNHLAPLSIELPF